MKQIWLNWDITLWWSFNIIIMSMLLLSNVCSLDIDCLLYIGFEPYWQKLKVERVIKFAVQMKLALKEAKSAIYRS